ncbi:hypothetical protein PMIN02_008206 [Paraphaeosphaeria minitans]
MKMKKRVLCVYDGTRRLWKDDMMLDHAFEVRMKLPDGKSYVTDLDVQTLKRADALHGATPEEKGRWTPDNILGGGAAKQQLSYGVGTVKGISGSMCWSQARDLVG